VSLDLAGSVERSVFYIPALDDRFTP